MTNQQKSDLQWRIRYYIGTGETNEFIIGALSNSGFSKAIIKKYIKAFRA